MKIIDFETIKNLNISPLVCYRWVTEAIANEKINTVLPAKISMKPGINGVFYNCMPVVLNNCKVAGIKLVTRYPQNIPTLRSELLLYDLGTGELKAFMDADYITTMRTGAVAVHSIKLLAKENWSTISFIGLGNTSRATLLTLLDVFPDRKIVIKLKKYKDQHIDFINRFSEYENITFIVCDTYEKTIVDSDIIISAVTYFENNICDEKCFQRGCLLIPIHTMGFQNCDLVFDKIYADDKKHVKGFKYFSDFKRFAETSDVVSGKVPGRESNDERILVYNIGIAMHDIYFANKIEKMVSGVDEVDLKKPKKKFWI